MKKIITIVAILFLASCAHKTLKAPKKAPCDFSEQVISDGYENNTK